MHICKEQNTDTINETKAFKPLADERWDFIKRIESKTKSKKKKSCILYK